MQQTVRPLVVRRCNRCWDVVPRACSGEHLTIRTLALSSALLVCPNEHAGGYGSFSALRRRVRRGPDQQHQRRPGRRSSPADGVKPFNPSGCARCTCTSAGRSKSTARDAGLPELPRQHLPVVGEPHHLQPFTLSRILTITVRLRCRSRPTICRPSPGSLTGASIVTGT